MKKFEYAQFEERHLETEVGWDALDWMNKLGSEGWEIWQLEYGVEKAAETIPGPTAGKTILRHIFSVMAKREITDGV